MVSDDPQLELWDEVEEVAAHEAGGHLVAAGHGLDFGLVPAPAFLGFLRDDQAVAVQLGDVGRVSLSVGGDECADIGDRRVVAEDGRDSVDEGRFAVGAGAVGKHELMLGRDAGAAISAEALQERPQLWIGRDALEEGGPDRMRRFAVAEGPPAVILLILSEGSAGRSLPVPAATVPHGVASRKRSRFQSASVMAKARSVCANRSTPLVKLVLRPSVFTLIVSLSVRSRTSSRAQAKASLVRSCSQ